MLKAAWDQRTSNCYLTPRLLASPRYTCMPVRPPSSEVVNMSSPVCRFTLLLATAATLLLAGCAGVSPSRLLKATEPSELSLTSDVEWEFKLGSLRPMVYRYRLAAGRYVAEYQDANGIYFRGDGDCFSQEAISVSAEDQRIALGKVFVLPCGVYLPRAPEAEAKWFQYVGAPPKLQGSTAAPVSGQDTTTVAMTTALSMYPTQPVQASAGGAIGGIVVAAIIAGEKGNLQISEHQPPTGAIRRAVLKGPDSPRS